MKPFPPTLREKRRYIHFTVRGSQAGEAVAQAINDSMLSLFGEDGYAKANFSIVDYSAGMGVCRCTNDWLDNSLVALAFVSQIDAKPARIDVLGVSGTLKALGQAKGI